MNPLVSPHLEYIPEQAHGENIYKLSQSAKWLKHLAPDLRVQMVESRKKHFYILEPVQLRNSEITVPVFFHTEKTNLFARCVTPIFKSNTVNTKVKIGIPKTILFDDENLKIVPLEDFDLTYLEIKTMSGQALSECCKGEINGQDFVKLKIHVSLKEIINE
jgi:hypothetical protein